MAIFLKLIYRFSAVHTKISAGFFVEINKLVLKFIRKCKRPRIVQKILKKNKVGGLMLLDFKAYYKAILIKIS